MGTTANYDNNNRHGLVLKTTVKEHMTPRNDNVQRHKQ